MEPGIYFNLSNDEYHGGPGINKGLLDVVARSPLHAKFVLDQSNDDKPAPTAAMALGTALHTLVLEPAKFADEYAVAPKVDRRTKVGKEEWAAFQEANAGKTLIDEEQHEQLLGMAHAIKNHPAASALLSGEGVAEASCYWIDGATGELCRCRPDWWRKDGVLVDLKSTHDASPEGFAKSLVDYRYHVQAPWYLTGANVVWQGAANRDGWAAPRAFAFIAVEKTAPYAVAVYVLDSESMEIGRRLMRADLDTLATCRKTGIWPGYGDTLQQLGVPQWYLLRHAHLTGAA